VRMKPAEGRIPRIHAEKMRVCDVDLLVTKQFFQTRDLTGRPPKALEMKRLQLAQVARACIFDCRNVPLFHWRERNQRHFVAALAEEPKPPMRMDVTAISEITDPHFLCWLQVEATSR